MALRFVLTITLALLVIAGTLRLLSASERQDKADRFFAQASLGQPEYLLVDALGKPDEVSACGQWLWWEEGSLSPDRNDGRCVKWVRYNYFLNAYGFGFSKDGKLVARYHYISD